MRVTLLGSAAFAIPTLDALIEGGHEVMVGTQPARRAGRGRKLTPTQVALRGAELGLPVRELEDINDRAALDWLSSGQPDLLVVVAFGQKLGAAVRAAAPWGCLNIHPSLLPRWRGAAPVPAALLAGDAETGVCIIDVVERMDAGEVLVSRATSTSGKTAGDLLDELSRTGATLLLDAMDAIARGDAERTPQDESAVTHARKLQPDDGRIRWEHSGIEVERRVNAVTPRPGAFAMLPDGQRLSILAGESCAAERGPLPGEVLANEPPLVVACGEGAYRILRLKRQGGRPMDTAAFLRGTPIPAGTRLGP